MMRGAQGSTDPFLAGHRRAAAVQAAIDVARRYGAGRGHAEVIDDTDTTIVWLAPHRLVAKVAMVAASAHAARRLLRELRIAQHLARGGAPVAGPSDLLPGRVHLEDRFAMTFWEYHPPVEGPPTIDLRQAARSLADLHAALATCPVALDSFTAGIEAAGAALADAGRIPALPARDRLLLQTVYTRLRAQVAERDLREVVLHGDPSRSNLLVTAEGYLWIDMETVCRGPVEWDLAALPGHGEGVFAGVDTELLSVLRDMRSVTRVVRSWPQQAGRRHLARLRRRYPAL